MNLLRVRAMVGYLFNLWYNDAELAVNAIAAVNPNILVGVYGMDWGNSLVDFYSKPLPETNVVYDAEGAYMAYQVGYIPMRTNT